MGFGQAGAKRCWGCLKVINWGWRWKSQKRGSFHREGSFSLCNTAVLQNLFYCKSCWVYTVEDFIGYLFSHYTIAVLHVWGWQSQKCNSRCPNETLNGLFQKKFSSFLLYPWKLIILNPTPFPICFFFHYSVCTVISDCSHPFDKSTFTHTVSQEYIIAIENTYLNGVFLKSKISIFP